jgi:hypothetical protein
MQQEIKKRRLTPGVRKPLIIKPPIQRGVKRKEGNKPNYLTPSKPTEKDEIKQEFIEIEEKIEAKRVGKTEKSVSLKMEAAYPLKLTQTPRRRSIKRRVRVFATIRSKENETIIHEIAEKIASRANFKDKIKSMQNIQRAYQRIDEILIGLKSEDFIYIDAIMTLADRETGNTAISRGYYNYNAWWRDVQWNLMTRHGISEEDANALRKKLEDYFASEGEVALFPFLGEYYEIKSRLLDVFRDEIKQNITRKIEELTEMENKFLFLWTVYADKHNVSLSGADFSSLRNFYKDIFGEEFKGSPEELIVKTGLTNRSTRITAKGYNNGYWYTTTMLELVGEELKARLAKKIEYRN